MNVYAPQLLKQVLGGRFGNKREDVVSNVVSPFADAAGKKGAGRDGFSIQANLLEFLDPTAGMDENAKNDYLNRIMQKLKSGKKLSAEEMNYLRAKNPQLYLQAARVQAMRENLKNQMESCTSKEAVENAYSLAVGLIAEEDPMKEALAAAYDDVAREFKKSEKYQSLPAAEEEAKKKKEKQTGQDRIEPEKQQVTEIRGLKEVTESQFVSVGEKNNENLESERNKGVF